MKSGSPLLPLETFESVSAPNQCNEANKSHHVASTYLKHKQKERVQVLIEEEEAIQCQYSKN